MYESFKPDRKTYTRTNCICFVNFYKKRQARNQEEARGAKPPLENLLPPGKICWTYFESIEHSLENLGHSQKTLRPTWCLKLVTGLRKGLKYIDQTKFCPRCPELWKILYIPPSVVCVETLQVLLQWFPFPSLRTKTKQRIWSKPFLRLSAQKGNIQYVQARYMQ